MRSGNKALDCIYYGAMGLLGIIITFILIAWIRLAAENSPEKWFARQGQIAKNAYNQAASIKRSNPWIVVSVKNVGEESAIIMENPKKERTFIKFTTRDQETYAFFQTIVVNDVLETKLRSFSVLTDENPRESILNPMPIRFLMFVRKKDLVNGIVKNSLVRPSSSTPLRPTGSE